MARSKSQLAALAWAWGGRGVRKRCALPRAGRALSAVPLPFTQRVSLPVATGLLGAPPLRTQLVELVEPSSQKPAG